MSGEKSDSDKKSGVSRRQKNRRDYEVGRSAKRIKLYHFIKDFKPCLPHDHDRGIFIGYAFLNSQLDANVLNSNEYSAEEVRSFYDALVNGKQLVQKRGFRDALRETQSPCDRYLEKQEKKEKTTLLTELVGKLEEVDGIPAQNLRVFGIGLERNVFEKGDIRGNESGMILTDYDSIKSTIKEM